MVPAVAKGTSDAFASLALVRPWSLACTLSCAWYAIRSEVTRHTPQEKAQVTGLLPPWLQEREAEPLLLLLLQALSNGLFAKQNARQRQQERDLRRVEGQQGLRGTSAPEGRPGEEGVAELGVGGGGERGGGTGEGASLSGNSSSTSSLSISSSSYSERQSAKQTALGLWNAVATLSKQGLHNNLSKGVSSHSGVFCFCVSHTL